MTRPTAKGKKRRSEIEADAEAAAKLEEAVAKNVVKANDEPRPRNTVPTKQVVNIMADEIQAFYEESGLNLDTMNAQDKALTLWRGMSSHGGTAKEISVPLVLCKKHR